MIYADVSDMCIVVNVGNEGLRLLGFAVRNVDDCVKRRWNTLFTVSKQIQDSEDADVRGSKSNG